MRRMAPGACNEMPDVIVTAPLPSPPFARCPNVTPVGTRAALHDATIWLRFALSPRSGRHRLLEVIMPASTPRLQSRCPLPRRAFLSAAAAAAGGLALACVDRATGVAMLPPLTADRKSTRLNSSHGYISYAVFCLKKKKLTATHTHM